MPNAIGLKGNRTNRQRCDEAPFAKSPTAALLTASWGLCQVRIVRPHLTLPHVMQRRGRDSAGPVLTLPPDLLLASASSDMLRWSMVLLSHTMDAVRSY